MSADDDGWMDEVCHPSAGNTVFKPGLHYCSLPEC